jgi:hypothetical protein
MIGFVIVSISLSVVVLGVHGSNAEPCGAVGSSVFGFDEPPFLQTVKELQRAISQNMAVACEAGNFAHFAVRHALKMDGSTLRQNVQNTLFVF